MIFPRAFTMKSVLLAAAFLALLVPATLAGNVLVVDASGAGAYTSIQAAVTAAADGDVILVKSGTYDAFTVDDKALAIAGDTGAAVLVQGAIGVTNLAAQKTVVLASLSSVGVPALTGVGQYGLYLSNNLGSIRAEDCSFTGAGNSAPCSGPSSGWDGTRILSSADVALVTSSSLGGRSSDWGLSGHGLYAEGSSLDVFESLAAAGTGDSCCDGGNGGDGIRLVSSSNLFAAASSAIGGDGADAGCTTDCSIGGDGGHGLVCGGSSVHLLQVAAEGGSGGNGVGGLSCGGESPWGSGGFPFVGSPQFLPGSARRMTSPNVVRENTTAAFRFFGTPGESAHLFIASRTQRRLLLGWNGVLLVSPNAPHLMTTSLGTIPPSGALNVSIPISELGPGVQSRVLHFQPVFIAPSGTRQLGTPASLVILDQAF